MTPAHREPRRVVALLVLAACAVAALTGCTGATTSAPDAERSRPATQQAPVQPALALPPTGADVVFFGDSYTVGVGAPADSGFAPLTADALGWHADVQGVSGSGFVARVGEGLDYPARLAALGAAAPDLVVVEGGLNDALTHADPGAVTAAARRTLTGLSGHWPGVPLVVVGPPQVPAADPAAVRAVDQVLSEVTGELAVRYVSPLREDWPVEPSARADGIHPDTAGHALFAARLVADLRAAAR